VVAHIQTTVKNLTERRASKIGALMLIDGFRQANVQQGRGGEAGYGGR